MALSPWKRLAQLILRRRPADQVRALISDDRNASNDVVDTRDVAFANSKVDGGDTSELEPIVALADEILQSSKAELAGAVETAAESEAAREPLPDEKLPAAHEVKPTEQPLQPHEDQAKKPRKDRRRPTKTAPPVQAEQDQIPPGNITTSHDTLSSPSDLTALDEEIRQLRGQLSGKLRVQNAQLKQMLKRFERR